MPFFTADYSAFKEVRVQGRYVTHDHLLPLMKQLDSNFKMTELGKSVNGTIIESIDFGKGRTKILLWSQMHGNESTTTKAIFDVLNFIASGNETAKTILEHCSIKIIPLLNPDGAMAYSRVNANGIDLNRDAQALSQPESRILRKAYDDFQPDFCFNLHDQRTMYNVGDTDKPATISFLAPAFDEERSISEGREKVMRLICSVNKVLQGLIPGQIGRYDDAFNANCVGDTFQMLSTPTILFEAGHFPDDYERERTREYIFIALIEAMAATFQTDCVKNFSSTDYLTIPENEKRYFDILIQNAHFLDVAYDKGTSLGMRFEEILVDGVLQFVPKLESVFGEGHFLGHKIFDCSRKTELQELKLQDIILKGLQ